MPGKPSTLSVNALFPSINNWQIDLKSLLCQEQSDDGNSAVKLFTMSTQVRSFSMVWKTSSRAMNSDPVADLPNGLGCPTSSSLG